MLYVCENVSEYVCMHTAVACVHKRFTLTGSLKSGSANVCEAAPNTRLKQLLAGEKHIYSKAKIFKSLHHYVLSQ